MKKIIFLVLIALFTKFAFAQSVAINSTGNSADPSSMLDVSSSNKGMLVPRMTTLQRQAIASPANGLLVFDTNTNSFWFYSGVWKEIANSSGGPTGPAGGDLSGTYPNPNVVKIQNLDVAFGVPFDKQVLKWDMVNNRWQGMNDSLFLPYDVSFGSPTRLFGITNTNTTAGSVAVFGRNSNAGSGVNPAFTMGVWGDNSTGVGVIGTSNTGIGAYGFSSQNHGVYGYASNNSFAGIYGTHANNGIGVMGEMQGSGIGVYGKGTGTTGKAGVFELTNPQSLDTVLKVVSLGFGRGINVNMPNTSSLAEGIRIDNFGTGYGIYSHSVNGSAGRFEISNPANSYNNVVDVINEGLKSSVYMQQNNINNTLSLMVGSNYSLGNGLTLGMYNMNSTANGIEILHNGKGTAGYFYKNNTSGSVSDIHKPAVFIENNSKGNALKVKSLHTPSVNAGIDVEYDGQAFGVNINSTKGALHAASTSAVATIVADNYFDAPAIKANGDGDTAVILAENSAMFGKGVQANVTGSQAVAIKGIANTNLAAVWGTNSMSSGAGVRGTTTASGVGYAIFGETGLNSNGVAGHFINNNPNGTLNTLWVLDNSKGETVRIQVNNDLNNSDALRIEQGGTGNIARFTKDANERVTFSNNGNIMTVGTLTVKNNKGIVRNSSSTQMRMETFTAQGIYFNMPQGASVSVNINFSTAFSSPPVVSIGNIEPGFSGPCEKMIISVKNVTATGCTITMYNPSVSGNPTVSGTWNFMAVGAE